MTERTNKLYTLACSSSSKSRTPAPSPITKPSRFCHAIKTRLTKQEEFPNIIRTFPHTFFPTTLQCKGNSCWQKLDTVFLASTRLKQNHRRVLKHASNKRNRRQDTKLFKLTVSQGREAFVGSLFLCERARHATKPPNPALVHIRYDFTSLKFQE